MDSKNKSEFGSNPGRPTRRQPRENVARNGKNWIFASLGLLVGRIIMINRDK